MGVNNYFSENKWSQQQNLVEDLVVEVIQIHGNEFYYLPRTLVNENKLFGEDPISAFNDSFLLEMYLENVDEWGGEGDFISKFGLEIRDSGTLIVSKKRFHDEIGQTILPLEGDLIYFPITQGIFEIKHVETENPFWQLGKNYTYKLSIELYSYSEEDFNTGLDELDSLIQEEEFTNIMKCDGLSGAIGTFVPDEFVYQGATFGPNGISSDVYGTVVSFIDNTLVVDTIVGGSFTGGTLVKSSDDSAQRWVNSEFTGLSAAGYSDNKEIQDIGDDIINWDEKSPFGTY